MTTEPANSHVTGYQLTIGDGGSARHYPGIASRPTPEADAAEPACDASNAHLAQGHMASSMQFHATGPTDPDTPIYYTLTRKADAYLDGLSAEPGPAAPEPEAGL
jgi:hypothetical protein